jgi:hypothetical protein
MKIKNTTIQNKTKQSRLNNEHIIPTHCIKNIETNEFLKSLLKYSETKENILFSIGCELVRGNKNPNLKKFLGEYTFSKITINDIPKNEFDLLGSAYQFLNSKIENLEKGLFYTGYKIAYDFVCDLDFNSGQLLLDPSCGSGSFLFNSNAKPNQIFGVDNDPIAVMIAKFNYFIKFPDADYPNIFCDDFFNWISKNNKNKFNYIIGNPPYGANLDLSNIKSSDIKSGESFSYFIESGIKLLKENGILRFLLPESILNVKRHSDIRNFILNKTNLKQIKKYKTRFSGVMSDLYMLEIDINKNNENLLFTVDKTIIIPKSIFKGLKNSVFTYFTEQDISIISKVKHKQGYTMIDSIFGLGVVTGDNQKLLFNSPIDESEQIYTGKEVTKYKLLNPNKHIVFNRDVLQQVAPNEIYRAPQKLVYKTINKHIKIAMDNTGSLTTNSANIFIPNIDGLDIHTVMGLLNSELYSYLNLKLFGGVNKVSKENLQSLPLPKVSNEENEHIKNLVLLIIENGDDNELQKYINKNIFGLTEEEIKYINNYNLNN